jgi:hypothetical protein
MTQNKNATVEIGSEQLSHPIRTKRRYEGTARAIIDALESTDATLAHIDVGKDMGERKIVIYGRHGADGEPSAVPYPVHKQLADWGFKHCSAERGDFKHSDEKNSHVYLEE